MTETVQSNGAADRDSDFWRSHVLAARDFIGTDAEYCRRNGINDKTFSNYKTKFGLTKGIKKGRPKKFIKLESAAVVDTRPRPADSIQGGADAKWMAEFVSALLSSRS